MPRVSIRRVTGRPRSVGQDAHKPGPRFAVSGGVRGARIRHEGWTYNRGCSNGAEMVRTFDISKSSFTARAAIRVAEDQGWMPDEDR